MSYDIDLHVIFADRNRPVEKLVIWPLRRLVALGQIVHARVNMSSCMVILLLLRCGYDDDALLM